MRVISIPANALEALSKAKGVEFISLNSPVKSFSASSKATAKLPLLGSTDFVTPASNVSVAVLDSGVEQGNDLNLAMQVDMVSSVNAVIYRDEFNSNAWSGDNGNTPWTGDWVEYDVEGAGTSTGNVTVSGGELLINDNPNITFGKYEL